MPQINEYKAFRVQTHIHTHSLMNSELLYDYICFKYGLSFNPICAVFFYPHFSCVRARYLKFYDFLNNIKTNLVMLFFCQIDNFCGHRALAKNGQKKAC